MKLQRFVIGLAFLLVAAAAPARIIVLPVERRLGPLELQSHVIGVEIKEQVAVTSIDMQFRNPHNRQLEAEFLFPVPRGAQVTDFEMLVNGKRVQGEVLEKKKAAWNTTVSVARSGPHILVAWYQIPGGDWLTKIHTKHIDLSMQIWANP